MGLKVLNGRFGFRAHRFAFIGLVGARDLEGVFSWCMVGARGLNS